MRFYLTFWDFERSHHMMDGFSVSAYCATLSYDYNAIKSDGIISLDLQPSWAWESQSSVSLKWAEHRQQASRISVWSFCFLPFCIVEYGEWGVGRSESLHGSSSKAVSRGRAITGDRVVSSNKSLEFSPLNVSLLLEFHGIKLPVRIIFGPSTRQGALHALVPAWSSYEYCGAHSAIMVIRTQSS